MATATSGRKVGSRVRSVYINVRLQGNRKQALEKGLLLKAFVMNGEVDNVKRQVLF